MAGPPEANLELPRMSTSLAGQHRVLRLPASIARESATRIARLLCPGSRPLIVRVPAIEPSWVLEEVAALLVATAGVAIAPREDGTGLLDAASDAIRTGGARCVVLLDADPLIESAGSELLLRWVERTESAHFLFATRHDMAPEVAADVGDPALFELDDARDSELAATIASLPCRVPLRYLALLHERSMLSASLERMRKQRLVHYAADSAELAIEMPASARARTLAQRGAAGSGAEALLEAVAADLGQRALSGPTTSADHFFGSRHRALFRHVHAWTHRTGYPRAGEVALAVVDAMSATGSLRSMLEILELALSGSVTPTTRLALESRRALLLKAFGRGRVAVDTLLHACASAVEEQPRVVGEAALTLAVVNTPEIADANAHDHIASVAARLAGGSERALASRLVAALAWSRGNPADALAAILEAMAELDGKGQELLSLDVLAKATVFATGVGEPGLAQELAHRLETEARRTDRADLVARARALHGCAMLDTEQPLAGIVDLTFGIDQLAAQGFHHWERWYRLHRGLAYALGGDTFRASQDFQDFVGMSRMMGSPPSLGYLADAMLGSEPSRRELGAGDGLHPCFLPLLEALDNHQQRLDADRIVSAPGFYSIEQRALARLLQRERGLPAPRPSSTLVVGLEGQWFQLDGGERVELTKMPTLRRVFAVLLGAPPQKPLSVDAIFALGWPGEKAARSSATNRVYVTMCRLRALGLEGVVVYVDGGFRIAGSVEVVRRAT